MLMGPWRRSRLKAHTGALAFIAPNTENKWINWFGGFYGWSPPPISSGRMNVYRNLIAYLHSFGLPDRYFLMIAFKK